MKNLIFIFAVTLILSSCDARIELDYAQWGDKAVMYNAQVFRLDINDEARLVEWQENEGYVTGVRRLVISSGVASIDLVNAVVTITVPPAQSSHLTSAGLIFYHYGTLIEPLGDSPRAGIPNDLTARSFLYRVHSADGTKRDWIVNIQ